MYLALYRLPEAVLYVYTINDVTFSPLLSGLISISHTIINTHIDYTMKQYHEEMYDECNRSNANKSDRSSEYL